MSGIDKKILEEITRYNKINNYIFEQEATDALPTDVPPPADAGIPPAEGNAPAADAAAAPTTPAAEPQPVDVATDPEVEKVGEEGSDESGTEELEITDLVNSQKNIETKQEEYFNNLFNQLNNLEGKLKDMENIFSKLNDIESKLEEYKPKTAQEKLELRSLDSGPYNQKLSDFFVDKQQEMEKSGKNEYVLTTDEVEDFSPSEIKTTFNNFGEEDQYKPLKY